MTYAIRLEKIKTFISFSNHIRNQLYLLHNSSLSL